MFSIVRKNKRTFRASMGFNTLGSILPVKLANPKAKKFKADKALLKVQLENTAKDIYHQHHQLHYLLLLKIEHRTSLEL